MILTSGTTGTPKGATASSRVARPGRRAAVADPAEGAQTTHIAAPLFHSWGFAHFTLGLMLGSTYVLRAQVRPRGLPRRIDAHARDALAVVPVMVQRILELPEETRRKYDTRR